MSIKSQYGLTLLLMASLFVLFISGLLFLINDRQYLLAALLGGIIYTTFFLIGKRISLIFLQLSLLKFLKRKEGEATYEECDFFIRSQYKKRISESDFEKLLTDIYTSLANKNLIRQEENGLKLCNQ